MSKLHEFALIVSFHSFYLYYREDVFIIYVDINTGINCYDVSEHEISDIFLVFRSEISHEKSRFCHVDGEAGIGQEHE